MEDENFEMNNMDFTDSDVEYVDTTAEVYREEPVEVSSGADFDEPMTYPEDEPIAYDDPQTSQGFDPMKKIGVMQDTINLTQELSSSSSEQAKAQALQNFSQQQLARFTSPKVIGPLLLFYAYRGRFGAIERLLFGAIGAGAVIKAYGLAKPNQGFDHPLMKDVRGRVLG